MNRSYIANLITVALGVALIGVTSVSAASTGGIGGRPANPDPDNPRTESIFIHTLDRGNSADDVALIINESDDDRTIELYAVDGVVTNTGAFTCRQKAEPVVGSGGWIKLSINELNLEPKSKVEVPFTLTAPSNADIGEHNACLVFADKNEGAQTSGNLRIHTRQAVRVVTTIPGDLHREVTTTNFAANANNRQLQFTISLKNKGNVSADVDVRVKLTSLLGKTKYTNGGTYPVLSNEKLDLSYIENDSSKSPFWGGWYKAGFEARYNTDAKLLGFDPALDQAEIITESRMVFVMPSVGAIIAVVVVLLMATLLGVYLWNDRSQTRKRERDWKERTLKKSDTLESLAKEYRISWEVIARTNKLRPPYILDTSKNIKLPPKPTDTKK